MRMMLTLALLIGSSMTALAADKPMVVLTGSNSKIDKAEFHRLSNAEELKKVWLAHLGKTEDDTYREHLMMMNVDFDSCMVIAVFTGKTFNSRGITVISTKDDAETVLLRYDHMSFQSSGPVSHVTPYAFIVVPKSKKPLVIEEDVQGIKGQPPKWKEQARFKGQ